MDIREHIYGQLRSGALSEQAAVDRLCELGGAQLSEISFFEEMWQECSLVRANVSIRKLIVFLSDRDNQSACARALARASPSVDVVFVGKYQVQRSTSKSYAALLGELCEQHGAVDAVWYCWSLEDPSCIADAAPIVLLLQGLATAGIATKIILAGEHNNQLERCYLDSWIGYAHSVGWALPGVSVAVVHAQAQPGGATADYLRMEKWTERLWDESNAAGPVNSRYVGGKRFELRVTPVDFPQSCASRVLRPGGTYWIPGGMGGLGYEFASHLARRYGANLILTGRSPLDERKRKLLTALEAAGGRALYIEADLCDIQQSRTALQTGMGRFGRLQAVVHAAGVESPAPFLALDMATFASVQAAKIRGTLVLNELLEELGGGVFVCYFSSLAAVAGDFGSCDYSVANRFQLAYSSYVQQHALAICWPLWTDGGMGFQDEGARQLYLKSSGQRSLESAQGTELFEFLVGQHESRGLRGVIPVLADRDRAQRWWSSRSATVTAQPDSSAIRESVRAQLIQLAGELLKLPVADLDSDGNLAEYGFDSILLAGFSQRLSAHFAVDVLPSVFFTYTTLEKLADYFVAEHPQALRHLKSDPTVPHVARPAAETTVSPGGGIAIVGMSGRFPAARSVDELWKILVEGREAIQEIPRERFDWRECYTAIPGDAAHNDRMTRKWMGVLPGIEEFDAEFFEISPREARLMDPRQRLLLQEGFKALEDAGLSRAPLTTRRIGMFVGSEQGDYQSLAGDDGIVTANHEAVLAARLSYFLDLSGPAMTINTACSSSLVALHSACLSLQARECDAAIAASANVIITPSTHIAMSRTGVLSPDGRCYAFDRRANGLVPAEAAAAIVLKRLADAERDGDLIYAVIRGSGVNYDGKTNGLTAPSGAAQTDLIREVCAKAAVAPEEVAYIVTHGTGTRLGDPVEVSALQDAFGNVERERAPCALTSIKTNVGHALAASGLVSLISLVQAMRHETIPASLNCDAPSDYIDWNKSAFYVNTCNRAWPQQVGRRRIGGVSSFGISGTNAHVIVEDWAGRTAAEENTGDPFLFVISAKTQSALQERARDLAARLRESGGGTIPLPGLSYTLLHRREHFKYRCAVVASDPERLVAVLDQIAAGEIGLLVNDGKAAFGMVRGKPPQDSPQRAMNSDATPERLRAMADQYCLGYDPALEAVFTRWPPPVRLPTYPFARDKHWVEREVAFVGSPLPDRKIRLVDLDTPAAAAGEPTSVKEKPVNTVQYRNVAAVRKNIGSLLAEALYLDQPVLDYEKSFSEMGVDSIIGVEFVQALARAYSLDLAATVVYEFPNIEQLAQMVCSKVDAVVPAAVQECPGVAPLSRAPDPAKSARLPSSVERDTPQPRITGRIAIVGAACRLPGAADLDEFWSNLAAGVDSVTEVPKERWNPDDYYDPDVAAPGKINSRWMGAIADIDQFDAQFFGISPAEAQCMDPQQRLFLQEAWNALEDAGYSRAQLHEHKVGTYVGVSGSNYGSLILQNPRYAGNPHAMTGNSNSIFAARLAYFLDLQGPAIAIDTACSSSLVAMHLACSALRAGEIDMAIVGGVSLYLSATDFKLMSKAGMLSTAGRCFAFDARADGIVPADGVTAIVLKRLEDAVSDGDHIHGVVVGSGINQDGRTNGITAPNLGAQSRLIEDVYRRFAIDPETISYVEAHGTGTKLGDPIEVQALTRAFARHSGRTRYCALGSVKSNIGHTSAAAGLAGVLKVILSLRARQLPPLVNFERANDHIDLEQSPFYINTTLARWDVPLSTPRRAAVSSFGYSGTNAHVVIEEAGPGSARTLPPDRPPASVVLLSARTVDGVSARARRLLDYLEGRMIENLTPEQQALELIDIAHTLQVGREPMQHRLALAVQTVTDLRRKLADYLAGKLAPTDFVQGRVEQGESTLTRLLSDSVRLRGAINELLGDGRLPELAELWCRGVELDWSRLRGAELGRRITLPAYPFVTKSFWFDDPVAGAASLQVRVGPDTRVEPRRVFLESVTDRVEPRPLLRMERPDEPPPLPRAATPPSVADITAVLRTQLAQVLCIDEAEIGRGEKFLDLGLDSILGVEWLREINCVFALNMEAPRLYDNPTLTSLAGFIRERLTQPGRPASDAGMRADEELNDEGLGCVLDELMHGAISLEGAVDKVDSRSSKVGHRYG